MIDNRVISPGDRKEAEILQRWVQDGELPLTPEEKAAYTAEIDRLMLAFKPSETGSKQ